MTVFDIQSLAAPGVDVSGLNPSLRSAIEKIYSSRPTGVDFRINSGFRTTEKQAALWADALKKYGSPEAARKWVAPPGKSQHGHGNAVDVGFLSPAAREWLHKNAGNFGVHFPLKHEPWHMEVSGSRGGAAPMVASAASDPVGGMSVPAAGSGFAESVGASKVPERFLGDSLSRPAMPKTDLAAAFMDGWARIAERGGGVVGGGRGVGPRII